MPVHDFLDIGDVLKHELLQGTIVTLDTETDTCTVSVGGVVYSALVFYHCEPDSALRSNGAIQDAATGFQIGDQVFVMKKITDTPALSDVKVVGLVNGCRHCDLGGDGYYVFYKKGDDFKSALCEFKATGITVSKTRNIDDIEMDQYAHETSAVNPLSWHIKKFRHNVMRNGARTESDLYCIWSSVYFDITPFAGWTSFATANPANALVANNLNTEIPYTPQLMTDLQTVNTNINNGCTYVSDPLGNDQWEIMSLGGTGDCEDFALTKAQALLALGYPASALHIEASLIAPTVPPGTDRVGGHAWLVVQTSQGDYALDVNSDSVGLNSALTFSGREFITRMRQIGNNWALISPYSAFAVSSNFSINWMFVYIFDPLLNIIYPLPYDPAGAYQPFLYVTEDQADNASCGAPSINFSADKNYIYYACDGYIYTYQLDENVLTQISKVAYASQGFITREGTIRPLRPAAPLPEGHPFYSIFDNQIPSWFRPLTWGSAEVISADGYYDFQYQYYEQSGGIVYPPIQQ